jgi:hypothetical protein
MGIQASICIGDGGAQRPCCPVCIYADPGQLERLNTSSGSVYRPGQRVEYSISGRQRRLPATVKKINDDLTMNLSVGSGEIRSHVSPHKVRTPDHKRAVLPPKPVYADDALRRVQTVSGTHYTAGDRIEYSSRWQADWVPASVESVNRDGTLNIKCSDGTVHNWVNSHKVRHMQ